MWLFSNMLANDGRRASPITFYSQAQGTRLQPPPPAPLKLRRSKKASADNARRTENQIQDRVPCVVHRSPFLKPTPLPSQEGSFTVCLSQGGTNPRALSRASFTVRRGSCAVRRSPCAVRRLKTTPQDRSLETPAMVDFFYL